MPQIETRQFVFNIEEKQRHILGNIIKGKLLQNKLKGLSKHWEINQTSSDAV